MITAGVVAVVVAAAEVAAVSKVAVVLEVAVGSETVAVEEVREYVSSSLRLFVVDLTFIALRDVASMIVVAAEAEAEVVEVAVVPVQAGSLISRVRRRRSTNSP